MMNSRESAPMAQYQKVCKFVKYLQTEMRPWIIIVVHGTSDSIGQQGSLELGFVRERHNSRMKHPKPHNKAICQSLQRKFQASALVCQGDLENSISEEMARSNLDIKNISPATIAEEDDKTLAGQTCSASINASERK